MKDRYSMAKLLIRQKSPMTYYIFIEPIATHYVFILFLKTIERRREIKYSHSHFLFNAKILKFNRLIKAKKTLLLCLNLSIK